MVDLDYFFNFDLLKDFNKAIISVPEGWKLVEDEEHKIKRLEKELETYKDYYAAYEKSIEEVEKKLEGLKK